MKETPNMCGRRAVCDDMMVLLLLSGLTGQGHVHPHSLAGLLTLIEVAALPKPLHSIPPETLIK